MSEENMEKLDISVFDESDLVQFQEKILIIFSTCVGLRGCQEHTDMLRSQIGCGVYPSNHPDYPNYEWWGLLNYGTEKTHKLSLATDHVRSTHEGIGKFPVLSDKAGVVGDIGGAIKRFCALQPPDGKKKNPRLYRKVNKAGTEYLPDNFLGIAMIRKRFQGGYKRMGFLDWLTVRSHAARGCFITAVVNDETIPLGYKCEATRHKDPKSLIGYATSGLSGGANVLNAVLKTASGHVRPVGRSEKEDGRIVGKTLNENKLLVDKAVEEQQQQDEDEASVESYQSTVVLGGRSMKLKPPHSSNGSFKNIPESISTSSKLQEDEEFDNQSVATSSYSSANHHGVVPYHASANENYSIYTQHQYEGLRDDLARLEVTERNPSPPTNRFRVINPYSPAGNDMIPFQRNYAPPPTNHYREINPFVTPSPYSFPPSMKRTRYDEGSLGSLRGFGKRNYMQQAQRVPSEREFEMARIRARVREMEERDRKERLRQMQEVEFERMRMYESYPFWNSYDEQKSLYEDSVENENEREQRGRKWKKTSRKRSSF